VPGTAGTAAQADRRSPLKGPSDAEEASLLPVEIATFGHAMSADLDAAALCRSCGACCSYAADWPRFSLEDDAALERIPPALVAEAGTGMRCDGDRCAALAGVVGEATSCTVYTLRPDVCRACLPGDEACRMARRRFNL
jgi:rRNA maturation protein Nop10